MLPRLRFQYSPAGFQNPDLVCLLSYVDEPVTFTVSHTGFLKRQDEVGLTCLEAHEAIQAIQEGALRYHDFWPGRGRGPVIKQALSKKAPDVAIIVRPTIQLTEQKNQFLTFNYVNGVKESSDGPIVVAAERNLSFFDAFQNQSV